MIQTSTQKRTTTSASRRIDPVIVCAADDRYAMPLAVTLHSAGLTLDSTRKLDVFLLDGGLSESSWAALKETLCDLPVELHPIRPDAERLLDLKISHHITHVAYYRLLSAELLPGDIDKALYLDSDLLICSDLGEIWDRPVDDLFCLAAVDVACPYVDARLGSRNFRRSSPYMAVIRPISNYHQLGLDGASEYFNSGVMVMNLGRWRREGVARQLLDCLRTNGKHVWCWDQYALNVVFSGKWGRLPPRWNQGTHAFEYPSIDHSPIDPDEFQEMRQQPAIVHFTTEFKPWHYRSGHPRGELFFQALDGTAFCGWRPSPPSFSLSRWWQRRAVHAQKRLTVSYRKLAAMLG